MTLAPGQLERLSAAQQALAELGVTVAGLREAGAGGAGAVLLPHHLVGGGASVAAR